FRGDLEVAHRRLEHADLDDVDDVVGAVERAAPVGGGDHLRLGTGGAGGGVSDSLRRLEPLDVDVVQHDPHRAELRERHDVAEQFAGELDAARTDDDDRGFHGVLTSSESVRV